MKRIFKFILCFSIFFILPFVFAELMDADEDVMIEESGRNEMKEEENYVRQKRLQMKQWLQQLESMKKSKKEGALVALVSKILNQDPDNVQALNTLGVFYLESGKTQLAKIIFTRALKKHPKNSSLHSNLAVIDLKAGKKEEAVKAFRKSLSYRYSNYSAAANLGTVYMQAYEYDVALDYLSLAYNRAKQYLSLTHYEVLKTGNNYAVALAWSGNFRKSAEVFEDLIEKNPRVVEPILNYAILLGRDLKNKNKSYQFLRKADLMDRSGSYTRNIKALDKYLKTGGEGKTGFLLKQGFLKEVVLL